MPRSSKKKELAGAFLALPMLGVVEPGGLIDTLSADAFKLFVLALTLANRVTGDGLRSGGVRGPRMVTYSLVRKRFMWHPRTVSAAFKELLAAGALVVVRPPEWRPGIREASLYEIGPAHPWTGKTLPTSTGGRTPDSNGGRRRGEGASAPLPTLEERRASAKHVSQPKVVDDSPPPTTIDPRIPGVEERSRSAMGAGPKGTAPLGPSCLVPGGHGARKIAGAVQRSPSGATDDPRQEPVENPEHERRKAEALAKLRAMHEGRDVPDKPSGSATDA